MSNGVRDCDLLQVFAARKRTITNMNNGVRDCDLLQVFAPPKRRITNMSNGVRDCKCGIIAHTRYNSIPLFVKKCFPLNYKVVGMAF